MPAGACPNTARRVSASRGREQANLKQLLEKACGVCLQYVGNFDEFNDVHSAFASLNTSHKRPGAFQFGGKPALGESSVLPCLHQHRHELAMGTGTKGLANGRSRHVALLRKLERDDPRTGSLLS